MSLLPKLVPATIVLLASTPFLAFSSIPSNANASSGQASYYGQKFHGRTTANGERFDMHGLTAAHRTLPFGTRVRVTNSRNKQSVTVRINDRGPFTGGRVIDLSRSAASKIGMIKSGVAPVNIEILD